MESMSKSLMDELSIEVAANDHISLLNNVVWTRRVLLVLFDNVTVDVVNIVPADFLMGKLWP